MPTSRLFMLIFFCDCIGSIRLKWKKGKIYYVLPQSLVLPFFEANTRWWPLGPKQPLTSLLTSHLNSPTFTTQIFRLSRTRRRIACHCSKIRKKVQLQHTHPHPCIHLITFTPQYVKKTTKDQLDTLAHRSKTLIPFAPAMLQLCFLTSWTTSSTLGAGPLNISSVHTAGCKLANCWSYGR